MRVQRAGIANRNRGQGRSARYSSTRSLQPSEGCAAVIALTLFLGGLGGTIATDSTARPRQPEPVRESESVQSSLATEWYGGNKVVSGEALVKVRDSRARQRMIRRAGEARGSSERMVSQVGGADSNWFLVRSAGTAKSLIETLSTQQDFIHVEPNSVISFNAEPNDDSFVNHKLWGLQNLGQCLNGEWGTPGVDINAVQAWDVSRDSSAIVVGVVDSGMDLGHEDLKDNLFCAPERFVTTIGGKRVVCEKGSHGFNAVKGTCVDSDLGPTLNHGTWVSGIIGARGNNSIGVVGVNWKVSIMTLNVADLNSSRDSVAVNVAINALEFAVEIKRRFGQRANVGVLNCSWECAKLDILQEWIRRAGANGILVVAAAGNNACDNDQSPRYPSSYNDEPNLVSVGAINSHGELWLTDCPAGSEASTCGHCAGSNYGKRSVDLAAPGNNIYTTWPRQWYGGYQFAESGTSMAAPFVSGAAALILSVAPLNAYDLKKVLLQNVVAVPSLCDKTVSGGRLDANKAIRAAIQQFKRH